MTRCKKERQYKARDTNNIFQHLPPEMGGLIARHLHINDIITMTRLSITTHNLFKADVFAKKAMACVVRGDVATLQLIAKNTPKALFKKGVITDPRGRIFYDVSAYQLIHFLCDVNMKKQIMPLIPAELELERQAQIAELGQGGADLIKLARDPRVIASEGFSGFTQYKQTFPIVNGGHQEIIFTLLENPDGIIYYQDENKETHLYYINRITQTLVELDQNLKSKEEIDALNAFKASFDRMEQNSARRTSDLDHQLINRLFSHMLHRQGIRYQYNKVQYRDSRTPFNLINAYRTSIRLYSEAQDDISHQYWRTGVGQAQGEEMWLLQRICEKDCRFYPFQADVDKFQRGVTFVDLSFTQERSVVLGETIVIGLGSEFALYKGRLSFARSARGDGWVSAPTAVMDLIAINRLVEESKAHINDSVLESNNEMHKSNKPQ
jgi:hypothetical protein